MHHNWQDILLAISVAAFNLALLPSVAGKQKPRLATSVITAIFLIPQAMVFFSLSLWYSFSMSTLNCLLWIILGAQAYLQSHSAAIPKGATLGKEE